MALIGTEQAFGPITIEITGPDSIRMIRKGAPGRGVSRRCDLWGLDQIESVALAASRRKGPEAKQEVAALRWALAALSAEHRSKKAKA